MPAGVLSVLEKKKKQTKLEKCVRLKECNMLYAEKNIVSNLLSLVWKRPKELFDGLKQRHYN